MTLHALENVDDAFDVTREFLTDVGRTAWLKLAVVVFFVGGAGGGFPFGAPGSETGGTQQPPDGEVPSFDPGPDFWLLIGAVVLVIVLIGLLWSLVAAVMEFVFVESLRSGRVSVREYWSRHWRKGVRLFGFRLVVGLFSIAGFALVGFLFVAPLVFDAGAGISVLLVLAMLPVLAVFAVLVGLINGFTTTFVVPIMILDECGVLAGWRRLWPTIKAEWTQYLAYAVAFFVLSIAGGIAVFVIAALLGIVLLVPFGILFAVGIGLLAVAEPVGVAWLVLVGVLSVLTGLLVLALAQVPVTTYLRYYALLVLGDVEESLDLIPNQRAAVRGPDEPADVA